MTLTLSTSVFSLLVKPTTQLSCSFGPLGKLDFYYSERIWSFIHFSRACYLSLTLKASKIHIMLYNINWERDVLAGLQIITGT